MPETPFKLMTIKQLSGILLVNKPKNRTSFSLVSALRRLSKVQKIGHTGTLDPFATGIMVMLIGREYTRLSDRFLNADKEYLATICLGIETDTYDCDGQIRQHHSLIPSVEGLTNTKKLYELARKGIEVEREPVQIKLQTELIKYAYPFIELRINCSKGAYIRSIAYDMGRLLGCGAHLSALQRVRSGSFHIDACIDGEILDMPTCNQEILSRLLIYG
jgi:tRNA pseudouridine55 synthase